MLKFRLLLKLLICVGVFLLTDCSDDCNVVFQSKLNATMECFTTYAECGFDNLQARFPKLYNKTGWKREPPRDKDIKPSSFCEPDVNGLNQSGLHVNWKLPDSYNAEGIAGYEFHLELDPPNFRCLVVILHEKPTQYNRHFSLNITIFPVKRHHGYMIVLHSLPRANDSRSQNKHVMSMPCKRGLPSADWVPTAYNFSYKRSEKLLTIWFPPPPLELNITKFKLDLTKENKLTTLISDTTEVSFPNQEPGNYTLFMRPYDEFPFNDDRCVCRNDENVCQHCTTKIWTIAIPEKKVDHEPKDYLHEVLTGLGILVTVTVVLIILYKILARHFGIEFVFGNSNAYRTDILQVLCIDVNSQREDLSKFQIILENDLHIPTKSIRIIDISEKNVSSKVAVVLQRNYTNFPTFNPNSKKQGTADCKRVEEDAVGVLICLLVSSFNDKNLSECLSAVRAGIPHTRRLIIQICAVTFGDKLPFSHFETALKCYCLNKEKQDFVDAVKTEFPKQTACQYKSIVYTSDDSSSNVSCKNGMKNDLSQYKKFSRSKICSNSCNQSTKDLEQAQTFIPEVRFLGASEPRRERYVSNDSGRGTSVLSYKPGNSPEDHNPLWEDSTTISSSLDHNQCQSDNYNAPFYNSRMTGGDCPSCDISFFPPDPSVISENSFDPNEIDIEGFNNLDYEPHQLKEIVCQNCRNEKSKRSANSIDSIMDKMADINKRSAAPIHYEPSLGEVHSVWEGHV